MKLNPMGEAAKICGAGSVAGEAAGVVIVLADEAPTALCEQYGYTVSPLRGIRWVRDWCRV